MYCNNEYLFDILGDMFYTISGGNRGDMGGYLIYIDLYIFLIRP